jgi:hypothetical protein
LRNGGAEITSTGRRKKMRMDLNQALRNGFIVCLVLAAALAASGCNGGDNEPDDGIVSEEVGDTAETPETADIHETGDPDLAEPDGIETVETVDAVGDDEVEEDGISGSHLLGTEIVHFKNGDVVQDVALSSLDHTEYDGNEAVRIQLIVDEGSLDSPYAFFFNFIASDGFNVLVDRLEGDYAGIPLYPETSGGFLYQDPLGVDGLVAGWDAALAFPRYMNVKQMDGGTIEAVPFPASYVLVICLSESIRVGVDLSTMTTTPFVDPHHPELGEQQVVPLGDVITSAALASAPTYAYKFTGSDGYQNTDVNLVPYENLTHAYIHPTSRDILFEEEWETPTECCWRVKETFVIRALVP